LAIVLECLILLGIVESMKMIRVLAPVLLKARRCRVALAGVLPVARSE
jgi:hypothetical protein